MMTRKSNSLLVVALASTLAPWARGAQDLTLAVHSYTHLMDSSPGVKGSLTQGTHAVTFNTGTDGASANYGGWTAGQPILVQMDETVGHGYRVLGQLFSETVTASVPPHGLVLQLHYSQPTLIPITFTSALPLQNDDYSTRWLLGPADAASQYTVSAEVGLLMQAWEIAAFAQYYGVAVSSPDYKLGWVVKSNQESFGTPGAYVQLDCRGHAFDAIPKLDAYSILLDAGAPAPGFAVTTMMWQDEHLVFKLEGALTRGFSLFLLRPNQSPQPQAPTPTVLLASPVQSSGSTTPPAGNQTGQPGDCAVLPPLPPPDLTCTPTWPTSTWGCPPAFGGAQEGGGTSTKQVFKVCDQPGQGGSKTFGWKYKLSVSVEGKINGVELGARGDYVDDGSENAGWQTGPGANGCGECFAWFRHVYVGFRSAVVECRALWLGCVDCRRRNTCKEEMSGTSGNKCSRTCN